MNSYRMTVHIQFKDFSVCQFEYVHHEDLEKSKGNNLEVTKMIEESLIKLNKTVDDIIRVESFPSRPNTFDGFKPPIFQQDKKRITELKDNGQDYTTVITNGYEFTVETQNKYDPTL